MPTNFRAVGVGAYYGFIDFKDWDGLPQDAPGGKYAKAGYVVGAMVRVLCYLVLGAGVWSVFG